MIQMKMVNIIPKKIMMEFIEAYFIKKISKEAEKILI